MKARPVIRERITTAHGVAHVKVCRVPQAVPGSAHEFKYSLAYVVGEICVLRYDNEAGKGDHKHVGAAETPYRFAGLDALIADFQTDIARWDDEHS